MKPLGDALTHYVNEKQDNWHRPLPAIMFAYNTRVHSTLNDTPFFLQYGRDARLPIDLLTGALSTPRRNEIADPSERLPITTYLSEAYSALRERSSERAAGRKKAYDAKHIDIYIGPDSLVMVYYEEPHRIGESTKLIS